MRQYSTTVVAVLACSTSIAWAERCIGPKDNSGTASSRGVPPIAAEDIVWCDDFDSYCEANRTAVPPSIWPGYPPTPDNLCLDADTPSTQWFQNPVHWPKNYTGTRIEVGKWPTRWEGWDGNPGWTTVPYTALYSGYGNTAQYHTFDLTAAINREFGPEYNKINGTDANPLVLRFWMYHAPGVGGAPNSPLYVELKLGDVGAPVDYVEMDCMSYHDCTCALLHPDAYCEIGACNTGTCTQWLCGFPSNVCEGGPRDGQPCLVNADCLKTCNADPQGPTCTTNYDCGSCSNDPNRKCDGIEDCSVCVGGAVPGTSCDDNYDCRWPCAPQEQTVCDAGPNAGVACQNDDECAGWPIYPIVNQQYFSSTIAVPHPPKTSYDPAASNYKIWSSIAFGMLAQLDRNPCNLETGIKPTMYHAAIFNGHQWQDLRANAYPGNSGDFNYDDGQAFFEIRIKSYTIEALLIAPGPSTMETKTSIAYNIPRRYLGPFNKISIGTGPGCKLSPDPDPVTGLPVCVTTPDIWRYPTLYGSGSGWSAGYIDRPAITGGVGDNGMGACCLPPPTGGCADLPIDQCIAANGNPRGFGSTCESGACLGACCHGLVSCEDTLSEDCDGTYLGLGTRCATSACPCPNPFADTDADGDVDQVDFASFQECYTGSVIGGSLAGICKCFDREPVGALDNDIDEYDWAAFEACASGPGILADSACDDPPAP